MCLIAFAINADPHCPLLIAANRDEAWDRPSAALARWALPNGQDVIAGRDLRDGGTWLGLTPSGRVAMLTNVRDAQPAKAPRSRGELVTRWLQGDADWADFSGALLAQDYGGFNLVVGDFTQGFWAWVSNRHPEHPHHPESTPRLHTRPLGAGVYGLSNAALDTPWPKTLALKSALASRVAPLATEADNAETLAVLTQALGDARPAPDALLPDTGVAPVVEQALSSAFVRVPQNRYGTRCSTVVQVGPSASTGTAPGRWQVQLDEWTHEHSRLSESAPGRVDFQARQRRSETLVW